MARFRLVASLAGIFVGIALILQLFSVAVGTEQGHQQILGAIPGSDRTRQVPNGDDVYMLGVGKADITG